MKTSLGTIDILILAGGIGSRIASVLGETPKVLAPVCGRPFLDYLLDRLAQQGAHRVVLSLGHLADKVRVYVENRTWPLTVQMVVEPRPLGTAGAISFAHDALVSDPIVVLNGDTWLDVELDAMLVTHRKEPVPLATIACVRVDDSRRYGGVELDSHGGIKRFTEKDSSATAGGFVNGGVYMVSGQLRERLTDASGSLESDVLSHLPAGTLRAHLVESANFIDIGTPESYARAAAKLKSRVVLPSAGGRS